MGEGLHEERMKSTQKGGRGRRREPTNIFTFKVELLIPSSALPGDFTELAGDQVTQQQGVGGVSY